LKDSKSEIVVVENSELLKKLLDCRDECNIKAIIQYSGEVENSYNGLVIKWDDFLRYSSFINDNELHERLSLLAPNKCATLIYTVRLTLF
jgi:long-subunit acyl-CoA synthetase (AMP-forming)